MLVQKLRLQRGWSQQQLADLSGLSIRTIQRIEGGQTPSVETLKSLAAVFEIDFSQLQAEPVMNTPSTDASANDAPNNATFGSDASASDYEERLALRHVAKLRKLYMSIARYVVIMAFLLVINLLTSPGYLWVIWPAIGWGLSLLLHAITVFEVIPFLGADWERREVEKRLGRKL